MRIQLLAVSKLLAQLALTGVVSASNLFQGDGYSVNEGNQNIVGGIVVSIIDFAIVSFSYLIRNS